MPLSAQSPIVLHLLQNLFLIIIAVAFIPLLTFLAITSSIISPYFNTTKTIAHTRQWRAKSSSTYRPRTILVTGVGMSKGLTIARSFYRAGHRVIGADFEPHSIPVCGRFSVALSKYYTLQPSKSSGSQEYINSLLSIVRKEGVDLWVSCSGVASAIEDGKAKEALEKAGVLAVQFGVEITSILHEKDSFIRNTKNLGLNVPDTHLIVRTSDALSILHPDNASPSPSPGKSYIFKPVGLDDSIRADMTRLPLNHETATRKFISTRNPSGVRPFVLQEFIRGVEYCTHSIAIRGQIKAFAACESSELLMHYRALPETSGLFKAMLRYTELYASRMGEAFTGHFSIDFLLKGDTSLDEADDGTDSEVENLMGRLFPIECNPRAHTAAVLFANHSIELSNAYLSLLPDYTTLENSSETIVTPSSQTPGYYWIGHEVVTRILLPFLHLLTLQCGIIEVLLKLSEFLGHLIFWKDGTWEVWDPWPVWWLYAVYWPGMFLVSLRDGRWWSRCNVSTTKMFRC